MCLSITTMLPCIGEHLVLVSVLPRYVRLWKTTEIALDGFKSSAHFLGGQSRAAGRPHQKKDGQTRPNLVCHTTLIRNSYRMLQQTCDINQCFGFANFIHITIYVIINSPNANKWFWSHCPWLINIYGKSYLCEGVTFHQTWESPTPDPELDIDCYEHTGRRWCGLDVKWLEWTDSCPAVVKWSALWQFNPEVAGSNSPTAGEFPNWLLSAGCDPFREKIVYIIDLLIGRFNYKEQKVKIPLETQ